VAVDGVWHEAAVHAQADRFAWRAWRCDWHALPGAHELAVRATDSVDATQPLEPDWNINGMGNDAVQRVRVTVR
jgi:hypothetical protein